MHVKFPGMTHAPNNQKPVIPAKAGIQSSLCAANNATTGLDPRLRGDDDSHGFAVVQQ